MLEFTSFPLSEIISLSGCSLSDASSLSELMKLADIQKYLYVSLSGVQAEKAKMLFIIAFITHLHQILLVL